jgi:hypothetical protein
MENFGFLLNTDQKGPAFHVIHKIWQLLIYYEIDGGGLWLNFCTRSVISLFDG